MNPPTTRRTFLTKLGALAVAPFATYSLHKAATKQPITCTPTDDASLKAAHDSFADRVFQPNVGIDIKVPSNRFILWTPQYGGGADGHHVYLGDWDGTFKLERGCTNPAYILADLSERCGINHDWVTHVKEVAIDAGGVRWGTSPLNWQMLADWGKWCDELVTSTGWIQDRPDHFTRFVGSPKVSQPSPRCTVSAVCSTREEMEQLRQSLRMHCLSWQSTDPRYRTSWPGVAYPEVAA